MFAFHIYYYRAEYFKESSILKHVSGVYSVFFFEIFFMSILSSQQNYEEVKEIN